MNTVRKVLLTSSLLAVAACGSHNHAPVVYGDDPARQTRIYSSKDQIYAEQREARARAARAPVYQQPVYQPYASATTPVQLTPVSAIYLDEPGGASAPAHRHKAKGYIEVQRGDTVYALARRFSVTPDAIIDKNDLKSPYALSVGQVLKLPGGATITASEQPARRSAQNTIRTGVAARDRLYTVRQGDTLYSISKKADVPAQKIASANRMRAPYTLDIGRQLVIPQAPARLERSRKTAQATSRPIEPTPRAAAPTPDKKPADVADIARSVSYTPPPPAATSSMFSWPVRGAIISEYGSGNLGRRNDGVNIAAPVGSPVRAAAQGQVVYRGSELEGFGNLLLIKHRDGYVTAYAHNDTMLVKKGDTIRKGQVIAKVGQTGAVSTPQLHFEIRQELETVDPVALLGKQ